jgi:hypothetical protein
MSFRAWKLQVSGGAGGSPELTARVWNLAAETRIRPHLAAFRRRLGSLYKVALSGGLGPNQACLVALNLACEETRAARSKWLGLLPVGYSHLMPGFMMTCIPLTDFQRYYASGPVDTNNPPRRLRFSSPYKLSSSGPVCRFIWLTFSSAGNPLPDDPTALARELGLAHYRSGTYVYQIRYDVRGHDLWIPTCLDASLYEAWAPPTVGHTDPWGLTRDLVSGLPSHPELLAEVTDHAGVRPEAELVSPAGQLLKVGTVNPDYTANRL